MLSFLTMTAACFTLCGEPTGYNHSAHAESHSPQHENGHNQGEEPFLEHMVQLTSEAQFGRAGEAYFSPDGEWIIFQAVPIEEEQSRQASSSPRYSMYVAKLQRDASMRVIGLEQPIRISEPGSANTCGWFHPSLPGVVLFGSTITPPAEKNDPAYARDGSRYSWEFPIGMEVVTRTIPQIVRDTASDPTLRSELLARPDVSKSIPLWERKGYDAEGSWSPDGRFVLYTAVDPATGDGDIYVRDLASGASIPLITEPGYDGGPFFSPDGKRICYRSDRKQDDILQLFVSDLEFDHRGVPTGIAREVQLTDDGHVNWAPFWHPSGDYLVYATSNVGHHNYEVFAIASDLESTGSMPKPIRITNANGFDGLPVFNQSGSLMMWTGQRSKSSNGTRTSQLFLAETAQEIPRGLQLVTAPSTRNQSPVSGALALVSPETRRYHEHVTILASEWLEGRYPDTEGIKIAEHYIAHWFERAGLAPLFGTAAEASFEQPFQIAEHGSDRLLNANNIGGVLRGKGDLARRFIVIGAHHDHLGFGRVGSLSETDEVHDGADDNASGTAAVLLLADGLSKAYSKLPAGAQARSIAFVTFSAEEMGLNGSRHFVKEAPFDLDRCDLMINFDMIGRITDERVSIAGLPSGENLRELLTPIIEASDLNVITPEGLSARSDHAPFYDTEIPVFFVSIDPFHTDYHRPSDESWKINFSDAVRATQLVESIVLRVSTHDGTIRFAEMEHYDRGPSVGIGGLKVRFGIMPGNYNDPDPGIVVQRVSPGTSADEGGVLEGDRLMRWNGEPIGSISSWMELMAESQPGDVVEVIVEREDDEITLLITMQGVGSDTAED